MSRIDGLKILWKSGIVDGANSCCGAIVIATVTDVDDANGS